MRIFVTILAFHKARRTLCLTHGSRKGLQNFYRQEENRIKSFEELARDLSIPETHYLIDLPIRSHMLEKTRDLSKAFMPTCIDKLIDRKTYVIKDIYLNLQYSTRSLEGDLGQVGRKYFQEQIRKTGTLKDTLQ